MNNRPKIKHRYADDEEEAEDIDNDQQKNEEHIGVFRYQVILVKSSQIF